MKTLISCVLTCMFVLTCRGPFDDIIVDYKGIYHVNEQWFWSLEDDDLLKEWNADSTKVCKGSWYFLPDGDFFVTSGYLGDNLRGRIYYASYGWNFIEEDGRIYQMSRE